VEVIWRMALTCVAGACITQSAVAQPTGSRQTQRAHVTVIDSVTVIDVAAKRATPMQRIVIRGDSIFAVQSVSVPLPDSIDERIEGRGAFAIPGLTDHHVHLSQGMAGSLEQAARGGVTMVQAMAGDNRVAGEFARLVMAKELAGPEIAYASVMAGPDFFADPRFIGAGLGFAPGRAPWAQAVTKETDLVVAVAAARGSGAEVLKLYAMMDSALVARLTHEAHRQGMRVVAHGTVFPARPLQEIQGGVDVLTHAPYLSWQGAGSVAATDSWNRAKGPYTTVPVSGTAISEVIRSMRRAGTALEPTLFVFSQQVAETTMNGWAAALTRAAFQAGVSILAGTDGLITTDSSAMPNIHHEMQLLVEAGLSPAVALAAATIEPARVMGREKTHGRISAGYVADIVLLNANPLTDIAATQRIRQVVLRGKVLDRSP
jgi:imidazolonepropionase-like amidohydrolase